MNEINQKTGSECHISMETIREYELSTLIYKNENNTFVSVLSETYNNTDSSADIHGTGCASDRLMHCQGDSKSKIQQEDGKNDFMSNQDISTSRHLIVLKTVAVYVSFAAMGMATAILGATLLELEYQTTSNQATIITLFTWRGFGAILGNIIAGILFNKARPEVLLSFATLCLGITMASVPLCSSFTPLALSFSVAGIMTGVLGTGSNAYIIHIWKLKAAPFIQGLHFAVSFGLTIAPVIVSPFLSDQLPQSNIMSSEDDSVFINEHFNHELLLQSSGNISGMDINEIATLRPQPLFADISDHKQLSMRNHMPKSSDFNNINISSENVSFPDGKLRNRSMNIEGRFHGTAVSQVFIPFFIIALVCFFGFMLYIVVLCFTRKQRLCYITTQKSKNKTDTKTETKKLYCRFRETVFIVMIAIMSLCTGGLEHTFGGYITMLSVKSFNLPSSTGALLATAFWAAFAMGRGTGILIIRVLHSRTILIINLSLATISLSVFIIFPSSNNLYGILILCILIGLAYSTMYANIISYTQINYKMTAKLASLLTVNLYIGMMGFVTIVGLQIGIFGPMSVLYTLLGLTVFTLVWFILIIWYVKIYINPH